MKVEVCLFNTNTSSSGCNNNIGVSIFAQCITMCLTSAKMAASSGEIVYTKILFVFIAINIDAWYCYDKKTLSINPQNELNRLFSTCIFILLQHINHKVPHTAETRNNE